MASPEVAEVEVEVPGEAQEANPEDHPVDLLKSLLKVGMLCDRFYFEKCFLNNLKCIIHTNYIFTDLSHHYSLHPDCMHYISLIFILI